MMRHISVKNVRNIPHGTHFAWIILTYSKVMTSKSLIFLGSGNFISLPGQETHWPFSMICISPDG